MEELDFFDETLISSVLDKEDIPNGSLPFEINNGARNETVMEYALREFVNDPLTIEDYPSTFYFVGQDQTGKSSIISNFINGKAARESKDIGLQFSYVLKTYLNRNDQTINIWELCGNGVEWKTLIDFPIQTCENMDKLTLFLMLDLSKPDGIWDTFYNFVSCCKLGYSTATSKMKDDEYNKMTPLLDARMNRIGCINDKDAEFKEMFPLPVVIVGAKYDIFEKFEPEKKKHLSRMVRLISYKIGATLCFYSNKNPILIKRMNDLLSYYAYDTPLPDGVTTKRDEPLFIPHGSDSFILILNSEVSPGSITFQRIKKMLGKKYGLTIYQKNIKNNPAVDPRFREPDIDHRREQELAQIKFQQEILKTEEKSVQEENTDSVLDLDPSDSD